MQSNKNITVIPPFECLENGCRERSEKCKKCRYKRCTWFYVPKNEESEN